jgi:CRISPR-associated protein Cmr4
MFKNVRPFFIHTVTSVHAGSGSEIGIVDLPIQRETHTNYPKMESPSLKGAIRHHMESNLNDKAKELEIIFGKANEDVSYAGAIAFSDARILLFPVRSMKNVFAWITCPFVLKRFNEEMRVYARSNEQFAIELNIPCPNTVSSGKLVIDNHSVILEEYTFQVTEEEETRNLAEQLTQLFKTTFAVDLKDRLIVLDDDDFTDFVEYSTEVNARIKINDNGTADNLWYEENVPPETIFYATLFVGDPRIPSNSISSQEDVMSFIESNFPTVYQIGGLSTLGRGLVQTVWIEGGENIGSK